MRFQMLACDYDATLATDGIIPTQAYHALRDAREAGWMTTVVTGRELDDLLNVCPEIALFDLVVAENGAVLYLPRDQKTIDLAKSPPPEFTLELSNRGIPYSKGRVIIGTKAIWAAEVTSLIRATGLNLQPILNRESAMYLPAGVDKASGLRAGAAQAGIKLDEIIGFGDAENDLAFLRICGVSIAVQNAIEAVKEEADFVTDKPNGLGVAQFIGDQILGRSGASIFSSEPVCR